MTTAGLSPEARTSLLVLDLVAGVVVVMVAVVVVVLVIVVIVKG